jgi:tetratricopeptide (TPR) repeat protein
MSKRGAVRLTPRFVERPGPTVNLVANQRLASKPLTCRAETLMAPILAQMLWQHQRTKWKVTLTKGEQMVRLILAVPIAVSFVIAVHADALDLLRAGLAARLRDDFEAAISFYTQAIDTGELTQSQLAVVLNSRGVGYDIKGKPDSAIADFNAAIQINGDYGEAYINRGLAWVNKLDYDRAIADFTAATRDGKSAFLAFNNRGNIYSEKGDYDQAIEDYTSAIRAKPDYADAYYGRANTYNELGDPEKAMKDFDAAIRTRPDFTPAYVNRGVLRIQQNDPDQAIADFDAAIRLDPSDPRTFSNRAYANQVKGEYGRAMSDLDRAIRLAPFSPEAYVNRGVTQLLMGRADEAVHDFANAVRLRPSDPHSVLWLHFARVRARQDDRRELTRNAMGIDHAAWPAAVVDLFLGRASRQSISDAILSDGERRAQRKRICEIEFYLATFDVEQGFQEQAGQHLRTAVDTCSAGGIEFIAVRAIDAEINLKR